MRSMASLVAMVAVLGLGAPAEANMGVQTVTVGNQGNGPDTRYIAPGQVGYGGVSYEYKIGKYEVTTGQYCDFLNAVAGTDSYGLYNPYMDYSVYPGSHGCNIRRNGGPGAYTYTIGDGTLTDLSLWGNRPVNYVSWGDCARFANWLHNGEPAGGEDLGTTEDGSYLLNGAVSNADLLAVTRKAGATWVIPSEDEWYKPAYHRNDGPTSNYWSYPMRTSLAPNNGNPGGDTGNSANYHDGDYTIGSPYWRSNVGYLSLSAGPYGTFDQGGNVAEWNEAVISGSYYTGRGIRGGSFDWPRDEMYASSRYRYGPPTVEDENVGFRVARVPEPGTIALLTLWGLVMLTRGRTVRS